VQICVADFEQLFDAVTHVEAPPAERESEGKTGLSEEVIRTAIRYFHKGNYARCAILLEDMEATERDDPRVEAFLGASRALASGRLRPGMEACVRALKRAFYIPDIYCALGLLLIRGGNRAKAHAVYQRGLRIDPNHPVLNARVQEMGVRRRPLLRFLSRSHPANRLVGMLRTRLIPA
jgi:Tfp pilus assembly protein PilF